MKLVVKKEKLDQLIKKEVMVDQGGGVVVQKKKLK